MPSGADFTSTLSDRPAVLPGQIGQQPKQEPPNRRGGSTRPNRPATRSSKLVQHSRPSPCRLRYSPRPPLDPLRSSQPKIIMQWSPCVRHDPPQDHDLRLEYLPRSLLKPLGSAEAARLTQKPLAPTHRPRRTGPNQTGSTSSPPTTTTTSSPPPPLRWPGLPRQRYARGPRSWARAWTPSTGYTPCCATSTRSVPGSRVRCSWIPNNSNQLTPPTSLRRGGLIARFSGWARQRGRVQRGGPPDWGH